MAWVTPPTFTALAGATAAMFNKLRDCLNVVGDPWSTYTPTVTGSTTNPTMGASTVAGRYRNTGQTWDIQVEITLGAGFSAGSGGWLISYPPGCSPLNANASTALGIATARDVLPSATARGYIAYYHSASSFAMLKPDDGAVLGAASPWAWAVNDRLSVNIRGLENA